MIYVATVHIYLQRRYSGWTGFRRFVPTSIIRSESKIPHAYRPRRNRYQGREGGQDQVQEDMGRAEANGPRRAGIAKYFLHLRTFQTSAYEKTITSPADGSACRVRP
mgnify:CR=1 FL=1